MKKFLLNFSCFLTGLLVLDFIIGLGAQYLVFHAKGGETWLNRYICHQMKEECIILGSSKGKHHYDANIIADNLKMTCWNASKGGNGIILMYGRYKMLSARYTPKILLYDVCTEYDLLNRDNHQFLGALRLDYEEPSIDSIFWNVDKNERFKMMSHCYRYSSQWLTMLSDNVHPSHIANNGYEPLNGKMTHKPKKKERKMQKMQYDPLKLYYLERLIKDCKANHTKLIFTISPKFNKTNDDEYEPLKKMCAKYQVPLLNHFCDKDFVTTLDYFSDSVHLNRTGATKYTKKIVDEVKRVMANKPL